MTVTYSRLPGRLHGRLRGRLHGRLHGWLHGRLHSQAYLGDLLPRVGDEVDHLAAHLVRLVGYVGAGLGVDVLNGSERLLVVVLASLWG